ncbi:acyltransferase [Anaerophaga thermohalophila]|uniref:acyltransferase n=1 Tax=Anaerophaga thermohalophila TaxID=177400 RepID=UPI000237CE28|nr:acyltransferase [Anaerophaga thermohalophila]
MNEMSLPEIHPSAVVDDRCEIGPGTRIWHFCHIMSGCRIGANCNIGQNVVVSSGAILGNNVKVQNNVSVYTGVVCEDDVFLGPSCVFTNVSNPRSAVPRREQYEQTLVKHGATIGANATIVCGHTIGRYAFIGAGAVVTRDVPDYALVVGNPARHTGWMSEYGHPLEFGEDRRAVCPESGDEYVLEEGKVKKINSK